MRRCSGLDVECGLHHREERGGWILVRKGGRNVKFVLGERPSPSRVLDVCDAGEGKGWEVTLSLHDDESSLMSRIVSSAVERVEERAGVWFPWVGSRKMVCRSVLKEGGRFDGYSIRLRVSPKARVWRVRKREEGGVEYAVVETSSLSVGSRVVAFGEVGGMWAKETTLGLSLRANEVLVADERDETQKAKKA